MKLEDVLAKTSKCCTLTWKEWLTLFYHGRTHVTYGLMISTGSLFYAELAVQQFSVKIAILIALLASAMSLTDVVAHLYYH